MKNLVILLCLFCFACNPYKELQKVDPHGHKEKMIIAINDQYTVKRGGEKLYIEGITIKTEANGIAEIEANVIRQKIRYYFTNKTRRFEAKETMLDVAYLAVHGLLSDYFPDLDIVVDKVWITHQRSGITLVIEDAMHRVTKDKAVPYINSVTGQYYYRNKRILKDTLE